MSKPIIELRDVSRVYGSPPVRALHEVNLKIARGELVAVVGPSGSGKSTLLSIIGTLDLPSKGEAFVDGCNIADLSDSGLAALRAFRIGFVFQQFHLAEGVTVLDNVADGLLYTGTPLTERRERAEASLRRVGLGHRLSHRPNQLSGGEKQRVAIARAVVGNPTLLLADEPTGNLDTHAGEGIIDLLFELDKAGTTIVVITHDLDLAARIPRRVMIRDGQLTAQKATEEFGVHS